MAILYYLYEITDKKNVAKIFKIDNLVKFGSDYKSEIKRCNAKIKFFDFFQLLVVFQLVLRKETIKKNLVELLSKFTLIIQKTCFYSMSRKNLLYFGKSVFYHNGLEMTGIVCFTIK